MRTTDELMKALKRYCKPREFTYELHSPHFEMPGDPFAVAIITFGGVEYQSAVAPTARAALSKLCGRLRI